MYEVELRLGNYVMQHDYSIGNRQIEVNQLSISEVNYLGNEYCTPISITKEWLVKFGFNQKEEGLYFKKGIIVVDPDDYLVLLDTVDPEYYIELPHIKYVHQLQNLYFDITGKELNFLNV